MTAAASHPPLGPFDDPVCGCCGQQLPQANLTELGKTPGVFICGRCARWAARRLHTWTGLHLPRLRWPALQRARAHRAHTPMSAAIPILPVRDLQRTEAFYRRVGLQATFHHPDYLIMRAGPVELHFGREPDPVPASCYVDCDDARRLWKDFHARAIEGLGEVEDFDYGMRE